MNGVHDLGGMHGFGRIEPEADEPVFHARWESRVYAMQRAMFHCGLWTIDHARYSVEQLPPATYLSASYYEKWLLGLESRVLQYGLAGADELAAGRSLRPGAAVPGKMTLEIVDKGLTRGNFERPSHRDARFKPGDRVRTRNFNPDTHTRLPRYARHRVGTIEAVRGCHVYPDSVTTGQGEDPQWLYTVVFEGRELWGEGGDPALEVSIDAFEPYLEPA